MKDCRFCNLNTKPFWHRPENTIIAQDENYYAISSVGALVEGWVLIFPKKHSCSMKELYSDDEFCRFTRKIVKAVYECYGPVIAFEHGPNREGSDTSCGTDHAHIHIVPYDSLAEMLDATGLTWEYCKSSEISRLVGNNEYLYYCDVNSDWRDPVGKLHILKKSVSQFFRQLIAQDLGCLERFNYKTCPDTELSVKTINRLKSYFNERTEAENG